MGLLWKLRYVGQVQVVKDAQINCQLISARNIDFFTSTMLVSDVLSLSLEGILLFGPQLHRAVPEFE